MNSNNVGKRDILGKRTRAGCLLAVTFVLGGLWAPSRAAAQGPLTPSNVLQNPAAPPFFSNTFAAEPLSSYAADAYSDLIAGPFTSLATSSYTGATVISWVYQNPSNKELAFVYQFDNTSLITDDLARATINDPSNPWTPFTIYDAGADGSGVSHSPGGSTSWTNGNPFYLQQDSGDYGLVVQFDLGNLGTVLDSPTDHSSEIWFATNATHFGVTNVGLSDSSATGMATAYAPAVPEPSTIALALIGGLVAVLAMRRRRSASQARC